MPLVELFLIPLFVLATLHKLVIPSFVAILQQVSLSLFIFSEFFSLLLIILLQLNHLSMKLQRTHVYPLLVVNIHSVEPIIIIYLSVHVCQIIWDLLQTVVQNAQLILIVRIISGVKIRNVKIHVLAFADIELSVEF